MRKGFSDARIVASKRTAAHNIRLFIETQEFAPGRVDVQSCYAAVLVAADLENIWRQHMTDRLAGRRPF